MNQCLKLTRMISKPSGKLTMKFRRAIPVSESESVSRFLNTPKPRADVKAIAYRAMNLGLLTYLFQQKLAPWLAPWIKVDQRLDDVVFRIGAKIKMEWMEVGVPQNSVPFDIDEFRRLLDGNQTKYN